METVPTERELQALKVLWQQGEATVREICSEIAKGGDALAYTTVLSLLQVMEQKGLVGHRANGKVYTYFALAEREPTVRALARGFLDRVFDGAVDEYLVHALESKRPSADEIRKLEELIAQAKQSRTPQSRTSARRKSGKEASP
jgi:BlaI family transcriptional regulator, penicillinase repressor